MSDPMWVLTITQEEWTYLDRMVKNAAGVPTGFRFALDSATPAQEHMTVQRSWREQRAEYTEAAE